ncbi:unnamed protein product [Paramecium octaurelia]|uniref:Uncharacterized protein n=1 Tax=Paramecium octaurelia TaxID=43137 RepID=A0A8S1YAH9_PAROT|nr:unnamed protein product [Paramecium octaurelia]
MTQQGIHVQNSEIIPIRVLILTINLVFLDFFITQ